MDTPVRSSVAEFVPHAKHVDINEENINTLVDDLCERDLTLPSWDQPVFPKGDGVTWQETVDFLMLGNAINFAFRDFETGDKYAAEYDGVEWRGAFGMWASLRRAFEDGSIDLFDGKVLASLTMSQAETLFEPSNDVPIPLLPDRVQILNEVGYFLEERYDGRFHNVLEHSDGTLYGERGLVTQLVEMGLAFADFADVEVGDAVKEVRFDKRAQLAAAMVYGSLQDTDIVVTETPEQFTIFADYNLPNVFRSYDILEYTDELRWCVDEGVPLAAGCREEVEVRACAVSVADEVLRRINERQPGEEVYTPHLDAALFELRDSVETQPHRCKTTAY